MRKSGAFALGIVPTSYSSAPLSEREKRERENERENERKGEGKRRNRGGSTRRRRRRIFSASSLRKTSTGQVKPTKTRYGSVKLGKTR